MHGDPSRLVPGDDLCYEEAVAHVLAIVLDGVGKVEALHPLEYLSGQGALAQVVESTALHSRTHSETYHSYITITHISPLYRHLP